MNYGIYIVEILGNDLWVIQGKSAPIESEPLGYRTGFAGISSRQDRSQTPIPSPFRSDVLPMCPV